MREIVSVEGIGRIWIILAVLSPLVGFVVGVFRRSGGLDRVGAPRIGICIGLVGPANWLLWKLYNALTDRNGLDTVRNFAVNLAVFLTIGLAIGVVAGRIHRPDPEATGPDTPQADAPRPDHPRPDASLTHYSPTDDPSPENSQQP